MNDNPYICINIYTGAEEELLYLQLERDLLDETMLNCVTKMVRDILQRHAQQSHDKTANFVKAPQTQRRPTTEQKHRMLLRAVDGFEESVSYAELFSYLSNTESDLKLNTVRQRLNRLWARGYLKKIGPKRFVLSEQGKTFLVEGET